MRAVPTAPAKKRRVKDHFLNKETSLMLLLKIVCLKLYYRVSHVLTQCKYSTNRFLILTL